MIESCFLGVHWNRWIIPCLPILLLLAMYGIVESARAIAGVVRADTARRWTFVAVAGVAMVLVAAGPAASTVELEQVIAHPSTRVVAARWIERHIPAGSRIAVEIRGPDLTTTSYHVADHFSLPDAGTVADYVHAGYRYFVVNSVLSHQYRICGRHCPDQDAFYQWLRSHARKLAEFRPLTSGWGGPHLSIYDISAALDLPATAASTHGIQLLTLHTTRNSHIETTVGPIPFVQRHLLDFAADAAWN